MRHNIQRLLTGLLVGVMLTYPALAATSFPDVDEDAEYAEAVEYVKDAGIMRGDDKGNFNPNNTVTRAEMATIICNMLGETDGIEKIGGIFTDVPKSHWASGYIARAVSLEIVAGYGDERFGPDDKVTYEQAVVMIICALEGKDMAQTAGGYPSGYLSLAEEHGFLEGISKEIGEPLSRGDIAILLMNCYGFHFIADSDSAQHE